MTRKQQIVTWMAVLAAVGAGLVPPWSVRTLSGAHIFFGHSPIWAPPPIIENGWILEVELPLLIATWGLVAGIAAAIVFSLRRR